MFLCVLFSKRKELQQVQKVGQGQGQGEGPLEQHGEDGALGELQYQQSRGITSLRG